MLCVAHDNEGNVYTGAQNGMIFKWAPGGSKIMEKAEIHMGVVHCIRYIETCYEGKEAIISGGTDQYVQFTDPKTMTKFA